MQAGLHPLSKFGDSCLNRCWVMPRTSTKWGCICLFKLNLTLKVKVHRPQNNRDLNQIVLHFCPYLVLLAWTHELWRWQARGWRTHTHRRTHTQTDRRRRRHSNAKTGLGKNGWAAPLNCAVRCMLLYQKQPLCNTWLHTNDCTT